MKKVLTGFNRRSYSIEFLLQECYYLFSHSSFGAEAGENEVSQFKVFYTPVAGFTGDVGERLETLQQEVNQFVSEHPEAKVQWLNSGDRTSFLIAIVEYQPKN